MYMYVSLYVVKYKSKISFLFDYFRLPLNRMESVGSELQMINLVNESLNESPINLKHQQSIFL